MCEEVSYCPTRHFFISKTNLLIDGELTLKILLDENIIGYKEYLEAYGWEIITVADIGLKQTEDAKIIEYARARSMVIITKDDKLSKIARVKMVRCIVLNTEMMAKMIDTELKNMLKEDSQ